MTQPYVIGIAGSSGSGKTFFLQSFMHHFDPSEITLVSQDDYYIPANTKTKEENRLYNFDLPTAIDRRAFHEDIQNLFQGKTILKEEYTFNNPDLKPKLLEIKPAPILIVEGLFIFHYEEINDILDFRIFIDAEEDIALRRRLRRDLLERGYDEDDVRYKWTNHVLPAFNEYLLPYKDKCDKILHNNTDNPALFQQESRLIANDLKDKLHIR